MIGTILIAVIGYGLTLYFGWLAIACIVVDLATDKRGLRLPALRFGGLALASAAVTRWLIGGAF